MSYSFPKTLLSGLLLLAFTWPAGVSADELTRQVQEELRRRHLFYRDIDGRSTADMTAALRKFQERQGFAATGIPDDSTLQSLGITSEPAAPSEGGVEALPDIPVLRSDSAPQNHEAALPLPAGGGPRSKLPPPTRQDVQTFVRRYFAACASANVRDELDFFGDRVQYFDHGTVDRAYIQNEIVTYDQRWTRRAYTLSNSVAVKKNGDQSFAEVRVAFRVANGPTERSARGETTDSLVITRRPDGTGLQIVSIAEARVTPASNNRSRGNSRRRNKLVGDPVVHGVEKAFHGIFSGGHRHRRR